MTGPAEGKLRLPAHVFLNKKEIEADVYVHLKGYAFARVTHLDIESKKLNLGIGKEKGKNGDFLVIYGIDEGLDIPAINLIISCPQLNYILGPAKKTRTWVGQKVDGVYIGFKKEQILKLEKLAKTL